MMKILLIDDEIWTRNTIKAFGNWNDLGINVIREASDGIEGLRLIEEESPQIVITDMNMPGMDGVDLLKNLKDKYPKIKVIVVSGYEDFNYTKQAIKSNALDYILKPIDEEELNLALKKCVEEINVMNLSKDISLYNMAKTLDNNIITIIIDEKKVIQRLLVEGNLQGINNALKRTYNNIVSQETEDINAGKFMYKIYSEVIEEQLLIIEAGAEISIDKNVQKNSIIEYFKLIEEMFEKAVFEISEHTRDNNSSIVVQVKKYIEMHYTEHISLDSLSNLFFVSKEYLSKAFKTKYEKNLMNYIIELRMEKAKVMMEDENISIKNISEIVGYEDVSYFYRVFKNYFGMSPGKMRNG